MRRAILLLFWSVPAAIGAQTPTISPGTRVRVEMRPPSKKVVGTFMSQTADSMTIANRSVTTVASGSIARIRVSKGRSHAHGAVRGMKIGAVVFGGTIGILFGGAYLVDDGPKTNSGFAELGAWVAAAALEGAILGAAIGGAIGAEKWTTIYSSPVRMSFRTQSGAPGAGVSIRF